MSEKVVLSSFDIVVALLIKGMKLLFSKSLGELMYSFEVLMLLKEKLGKDLGCLLYEFIKEAPEPWVWPIEPAPSPWDPLICVGACDGHGLPLFAP